MKTITINTAKELKKLVSENRKNIIKINDVKFNERYPMLEVSIQHATYYSVENQGSLSLNAPFNIVLN